MPAAAWGTMTPAQKMAVLYMCVYVCVRVYACVFVCVCVCVCMCMHTPPHTRTPTHTHTHTQALLKPAERISERVADHTYTRTHERTHTYTRTDTYTEASKQQAGGAALGGRQRRLLGQYAVGGWPWTMDGMGCMQSAASGFMLGCSVCIVCIRVCGASFKHPSQEQTECSLAKIAGTSV